MCAYVLTVYTFLLVVCFFFSSRRRHTRCALVTGVQTCALPISMAGHINGRFAQLDWTPLRYINRAITRRQLSGLYRMSRIGFVTPLRDGKLGRASCRERVCLYV